MIVHQQTPQSSKKRKKDDYNYEASFFSQNVKMSDYIFLPEGMEGFMLLIYFFLIPYGVGLIVIWLFVAGGNMDNFLVLDIFTIIPVWSIGYEVSAGLIMLNIILSGISFHFKRKTYLKKKEAELQRQRRINRSRYDVMKHYEQH